MGFLKRHEPELFDRFLRTRHLDARLVEVFEDLETVARAKAMSGAGSDVPMAGIVDELLNELRLRVATCEAMTDPIER